MINLKLNSIENNHYKSNSQKIRVLTEKWVEQHIYCASCGENLFKYPNNKPVADFYCKNCQEDFELKSKQNKLGKKIVDGAYSTMIERLKSDINPNFFFLNYDKQSLNIINFILIPKYFFTPEIIEKRKPLSINAKRAGWIGCNILIDKIPNSGKIFYIKNSRVIKKEKVLYSWQKINFLKQTSNLNTRGWLLDIIFCIEKINKQEFTLNDLYKFENYLKIKHPNNNHIKAKIRQQLQLLRDKNFLEFKSNGHYKLIL